MLRSECQIQAGRESYHRPGSKRQSPREAHLGPRRVAEFGADGPDISHIS